MNDRFTSLFGYTIEEIPDVAHWWRLAYPDKAYRQAVKTEWQARVEKALNSGKDIEPMEATVRCKNGSIRHVEARLSCVGETIVVTLIDLTARKLAEEALKKSEEKFAKAFHESPMAVTLTSATDHRYLDVNETFEEMSGYRREEAIGSNALEIGLWVDPSLRMNLLDNLLAGRSIRNRECQVRTKSGAVLICLASAELIEIAGEPCILAVTADITDRKQMERKLRESEDRLAGIFASAMDAIISINDKQRIVLFNRAAEKMFGCSASDAIGNSAERFIPPAFRAEHGENVRRFGEAGVTNRAMGTLGELWAVRANGDQFPIEAAISHVEANGEKLFTVIIRDLTERRRVEAALEGVSLKLIDAQEQERTRIARELHDDIGQRLALLSNGLEELRYNSPDLPSEISSSMGRLQSETSQIATDVQSLSHELHSSKLELLGMAAAMRGFCREFGEQQRVEINCETQDLPSNLPPAIALCLFRILQEALRNSIEHSGSKRFEVRSWGTPVEIHLKVSDSGSGFDFKTARNGRGLGLVSMEERLKLVKGTLLIDSQPNRGTTIHARVPLQMSQHFLKT